MPRGDKSSYSPKQKRQAEHIEEGYEKRGTSKKEAERRAWATVNKQDKGGKKSGSGRGKKSSRASSRELDAKAAKRRKNRNRPYDSGKPLKSQDVTRKTPRKFYRRRVTFSSDSKSQGA
jgi:hypothetical protein